VDSPGPATRRRRLTLVCLAVTGVALIAAVLFTAFRLPRRMNEPCPPASAQQGTAPPDMTPVGGDANGEAVMVAGGPPAIGLSAAIFERLSQRDPSVPVTVAIANGVPVPSNEYEGRLAMYEGCIQVSCSSSATEQSFGPKNIALTVAVVDVLVQQYGAEHGISVSESEITNALTQQATAMQGGLNLGGSAAEIVRRNLAAGRLTEPGQIVNDPGWRQYMCPILLRGKTVDALGLQELPPDQRGPLNVSAARRSLEDRLLRSAHVQIKVPAHLISGTDLLQLDTPPFFASPASPPGIAVPLPGLPAIQTVTPAQRTPPP
jgi:hypothetical protein